MILSKPKQLYSEDFCTLLYVKFASKEKKTVNKYWIVVKDMHTEVFRKECFDVGSVL